MQFNHRKKKKSNVILLLAEVCKIHRTKIEIKNTTKKKHIFYTVHSITLLYIYIYVWIRVFIQVSTLINYVQIQPFTLMFFEVLDFIYSSVFFFFFPNLVYRSSLKLLVPYLGSDAIWANFHRCVINSRQVHKPNPFSCTPNFIPSDSELKSQMPYPNPGGSRLVKRKTVMVLVRT